MEVFQLIIKDDIKAINKDIAEAKDWEQMVQRRCTGLPAHMALVDYRRQQ